MKEPKQTDTFLSHDFDEYYSRMMKKIKEIEQKGIPESKGCKVKQDGGALESGSITYNLRANSFGQRCKMAWKIMVRGRVSIKVRESKGS